MVWRPTPDALFFSSRLVAIMTPPPFAHGDGFGRVVVGPPLVVNQGHAIHPSLHKYTDLAGSHSTARPGSTARTAARPFLYVTGAGAGQGAGSELPPAAPVAALQACAAVGDGSGGGGGGRRRPPRHAQLLTATPSTFVPPSSVAPRRCVGGVPAPGAPVAHTVPPALVPPPPVGGFSAEANDAEDMDDRQQMGGGGNWSVHPRLPESLPRPVAGSKPTLPVGSRRPHSNAAARSQSPPSTRTRRVAAPMMTGTPGSGSGMSPAVVATRLSEMGRVHTEAISGTRREMKASRQELYITNGSFRELTKKTDNIAAIADRLAVSLAMQRRNLDKLGGELPAAVAAVLSFLAVPTANTETAAAPGSDAGTLSSVPDGAWQQGVQVQDAQWILDLKVALEGWLLNKFISSTCAADVWTSTVDINIFLRVWSQNRLRVDAKAAVRLLQREWPIRRRALKSSAPVPDGQLAVATPKVKMTIAYQYLHRSISHFLQRIGSKAVSAFSSHVHENLSYNKGTLRRLRGTRYKNEVFFSPRDAELLLNDDFFLVDSACRAGIVRALAAVFDAQGSLRLFCERGPIPGGPRTIACRLGVVAVVATKERATSSSVPLKGTRTASTAAASVMRTAITTPARERGPPQLAATARTGKSTSTAVEAGATTAVAAGGVAPAVTVLSSSARWMRAAH